jgi:hypothetical protein
VAAYVFVYLDIANVPFLTSTSRVNFRYSYITESTIFLEEKQ